MYLCVCITKCKIVTTYSSNKAHLNLINLIYLHHLNISNIEILRKYTMS